MQNGARVEQEEGTVLLSLFATSKKSSEHSKTSVSEKENKYIEYTVQTQTWET